VADECVYILMSPSGNFLRSFSRNRDGTATEARFFELHSQQNPPAIELMEASQIQPVLKERWASTSSSSTPEASATHPTNVYSNDYLKLILAVKSIAVDPLGKYVSAGYSDGTIKTFR